MPTSAVSPSSTSHPEGTSTDAIGTEDFLIVFESETRKSQEHYLKNRIVGRLKTSCRLETEPKYSINKQIEI